MEEEGLGGGARLVTSDLHTDCDLDPGLARDATAQDCYCTYHNLDPVLVILPEMLLHKAVGTSEQ